MENGEPLYLRKGSSDSDFENDDVWDDSVLLKAYDDALNPIKKEIIKRLRMNNIDSASSSGNQKRSFGKWKEGDACRAVFSEDGKLYEAYVESINQSSKQCVVRYVGYENEEQVPLAGLLPSAGTEARAAQEEQASLDTVDTGSEAEDSTKEKRKGKEDSKCKQSTKSTAKSEKGPGKQPEFPKDYALPSFGAVPPPFVPPPPPFHITSVPMNDKEALSAMLMSWYMSGFHTGYYQGLQQSKSSRADKILDTP